MTPHDPARRLLNIEVYERANGSVMTLADFLSTLLIELWNEEEGFDPKRPLGQSMWWSHVMERLEAAGFDDVDEAVRTAIREVFRAHD